MKKRRCRFYVVLCAGVALVPSGVAAQVTGPSVTAPPTREEVIRNPIRREPQRPSRLRVDRLAAEREPCALAAPELSSVRFTLRAVDFEGLREVRKEDLSPAITPFLGREHSLAVLCEIRDRAAAILDSKGYLAAVQITPQEVTDGNVRMRVLMGRLTAVRVRGGVGRAERTIGLYLERLTQSEVFNTFEAERYLLLAGDLPGYDVRLALQPKPGFPGELLGEVAVVKTAVDADLTVQNFGSQALGPVGALLRAQIYGLTGLGDRTSLSVFTTADLKEQQTVQVGHDFRLGSEGLTFGGNLVYSRGRPDLGDQNIDVDARTLIANIEATYPFVRRQTRTFRGAIGVELINQEVDLNDLKLTRDRLRVAYGRLEYQTFDDASNAYESGYSPFEPRWRLGGLAEVRQGLDVLDASKDCRGNLGACLATGVVPPSRIEADPTATLVRFEGYGEFRPRPKLTFALGVRTQFTGDPLLSFEEYSAGNYTVGRGYDPGTILGDSGAGFQAEVRIGSIAPVARNDLAVQPYAFFDAAWVWNKDPSQSGTNPQDLSSVGAGVRTDWGNRLRSDLFLAVPLERAGLQTKRGDVRLLFTITARLLPWSF